MDILYTHCGESESCYYWEKSYNSSELGFQITETQAVSLLKENSRQILAQMHFIYGFADGIATKAHRIY